MEWGNSKLSNDVWVVYYSAYDFETFYGIYDTEEAAVLRVKEVNEDYGVPSEFISKVRFPLNQPIEEII